VLLAAAERSAAAIPPYSAVHINYYCLRVSQWCKDGHAIAWVDRSTTVPVDSVGFRLFVGVASKHAEKLPC
jgi:hypothetical protein